ncbi:hydantoinase/oxoprolinase family protein [Parasphingopyxis algicola]|uniref:hydantoinase/oxoprolinase N-terminal domain-containing protein n=1 Tax=Parasphingopyxis algicola TaxID=2026624 RepID=UPI0015A4CA72|nr:hydantoinase/oxoprolinase family protein [Parasphingopyxis algicola]QLC26476.1 hydantoinase/oxoprolinase family protein [Parasphingopyxis algicola]
MHIGVDVGGTNTDAVLMSGRDVQSFEKRATSDDISGGIREAIGALLTKSQCRPESIRSVMIGTTQFTNAFVQAQTLNRVATIRIGFPAARGIPPLAGWPKALSDAVDGGRHVVRGGFEFTGQPIAALDETAVAECAKGIRASGVTHIAISGVFSQLNASHEERAAEIVRDCMPEADITLSSEVGRIGLLERENAAIMNASLKTLAAHVADAFAQALHALGIDAPFFISQNDGTLMSVAHMHRYPVRTFAAGPTNSLRGAALLAGLSNALVADIGGTTTDIGVLMDGFPRQSSMHVDIGGVRTNFRMPDILSLGLGGGSRVRDIGDPASLAIGPDSVGNRLHRDALVFGGSILTASDIAVAAGNADFGDRSRVDGLPAAAVADAAALITGMIENGIDRMKTSKTAVPLILVGGGAVLVAGDIRGVNEVHRPEGAEVANAVGAAIGQVSGEIDRIYNMESGVRDAMLCEARELAVQQAVAAGAREASVEIVEVEEFPLQYLPGGATRVVCRAVGNLGAFEEASHG